MPRGASFPRRAVNRLCLAPVVLALAATSAAAQEQTPACTAQLQALDSAFVEAMTRLLAAGSGTRAEQCAAVAHQLDAIGSAVDVHVRCYPPGEQLDGVVKMLTESAQGFRQAQADLGCNAAVTGGQTLGSGAA